MYFAPSHSYEKPDLIVFDLDGTLTDVNDRAARFTSVSDKLHIPVSTATYWVLKKALQLYKRIGIRNETAETIKGEVLNHLCAEKVGMFDVLNAAYDAYIPCSILSNAPREWGEKILDRLKIRMFFNQAVFREDMPHLKPDPQSLWPILEENVLPSQGYSTIWVCGDRATDVFLALNAGLTLPHKIIPVAFEGTKAATAIALLQEEFNIHGYIFKHPHDMACAIDPQMDARFNEIYRNLGTAQTHVATLTLQ